MRISPSVSFAVMLITSLIITACLEQAKSAETSSVVAVPEHFELDFDGVFELKKPSTMTPELLESKMAALAVVPREKLCRPVQSGSQSATWFSLKDSPVHNPVYSIFKSSLHPNFVSVVWQGQAMERFYCVYPAEKDQEVPPELLAAMSASLGTAHTFNSLLKQFEWELEYYSISAKYSTSVGKGDPAFLINVRNKQVQPVAQVPKAPAPTTATVQPIGNPKVVPDLKINLDDLLDWRHPVSIMREEFDRKVTALEKIPGRKPYFLDSGTVETSHVFSPPQINAYNLSFSMFKETRSPGSMRVEWKNGQASNINVIFPRKENEWDVEPAFITQLDEAFGVKHQVQPGSGKISLYSWQAADFSASLSAHPTQPRFFLSLRRNQSIVETGGIGRPDNTTTPATPMPVQPSDSLDKQGFVLDLDPLVKWDDPFSLAKEKLDGLFQSAVAKKGGPLWIHSAKGDSTFFGAANVEVPKTLFSGRLKVTSAYATWQEPRVIGFVIARGTLADEEWLYAKLDNVLEVTRRRMNLADAATVAHEWMPKNYRVVTTRLSDASIRFTISRPTGGFTPTSTLGPLAANLDALLNFSSFWTWTADDFEETYTPKAAKKEDQKKPQQFEWLSSAKDRARFSRQMESEAETKLTMFGGSIKLEEAVLEFVNGKAARATISFYNRGDSGDIEVREFDRMFKSIGQNLSQVMKVAPKRQIQSANAALQVSGWMWSSPGGIALLEYTEYDTPGKVTKPEFLRLKLAAPNQADWSMGKLATGIQRMELLRRVTKTPEGDVYITGVPMVDQGAKGYCVAASCQRLFEYMRIPCDQHEMARLVGVDAEGGADVATMQKSLAKIDGAFKVTFKPLVNPEMYYSTNGKRRVSEKEFISLVKEYVDKGVPLLWGLALGEKPEDPPLPGSGQVRGGHMRMVIGYNIAKNKLLFTDSWGAGHELKRMSMYDAYDVTLGLFSMAPRGL